MKNDTTTKIENAEPLLQVVADAYSPENVCELLDSVIFKYNLLHIKEFSRAGRSAEMGEQVIREVELLKAISEAVKSIKIIPLESSAHHVR